MCGGTIPPIAAAVQSESSAGYDRTNPYVRLFRRRRGVMNGEFTAAGKKELLATTQAWQQYQKLTTKPDPNVAILAARAYSKLGNYAGAAGAWEIQSAANPTAALGFECLAANAYAANQTRKGDLATAKALSLTPKAEQSQMKLTLQQLKTRAASPSASIPSGG